MGRSVIDVRPNAFMGAHWLRTSFLWQIISGSRAALRPGFGRAAGGGEFAKRMWRWLVRRGRRYRAPGLHARKGGHTDRYRWFRAYCRFHSHRRFRAYSGFHAHYAAHGDRCRWSHAGCAAHTRSTPHSGTEGYRNRDTDCDATAHSDTTTDRDRDSNSDTTTDRNSTRCTNRNAGRGHEQDRSKFCIP